MHCVCMCMCACVCVCVLCVYVVCLCVCVCVLCVCVSVDLYQQISFLDSIPDMHMHEHLPEFLDGLFTILGDPRKEIKKM